MENTSRGQKWMGNYKAKKKSIFILNAKISEKERRMKIANFDYILLYNSKKFYPTEC